MIFSEQKWNKGEEFQKVVRISSALGFQAVESIIRDSFNLFIAPLIEDEVTKKLIEIYGKDNPTDLEKQCIQLAQRANANLALWYGFNELNTSISSVGMQRIETETTKTLYKYQERELKESYREKGFNALDDLLCFFEINISTFPEFSGTRAYCERRTAIVPGATVVSQYLPINRSRIVFLRMKHDIQFVEDVNLPGLIGSGIIAEIKKNISSSEGNIPVLISLLQPAIVNMAAARMVRKTGSLTDRGLYFNSVTGGLSGNDEESNPASLEEKERMAKLFESDAAGYLVIANRFIKENFPAFYKGSDVDTFRFDNNGRKIFVG